MKIADVDPDLEAVGRARSGDARAFEDLIRRHGREVYALCRRFSGDAHEAEDLSQEVFTRAWKGLREFRGESSFRTWLFRIAVNACRSWILRRRAPLDAPPPETSADSSNDMMELLRREIAGLPEKQRLVLSLRVFSGLEYEDVAEVLGITPEAARVHLSLARKALSERLAPFLEKP